MSQGRRKKHNSLALMRSYLRYWVVRPSRLAGISARAKGKKKRQKKKKWRNPPPTPQYKASERNQMACLLTFAGRTCQGHDGHGIFKKKGGKKEARMKTRFIPGLKVWSSRGSSYTVAPLFEGKLKNGLQSSGS